MSGHRYALLVAEEDGAEGTIPPLTAVAEIDPELPVLLLVDAPHEDGRGTARPSHVKVLAKPFESPQLLAHVRSLVRTTRARS